MSNRRPVLAAAFALALLSGGLVAAGAAQAHQASPSRPSPPPSAKPRTKNAALPTTTKPKTVTTPVPPIKPRTKNAALSNTTLAPTTAPLKLNTVPPTIPLNNVPRPTTAVRPTTTSVVKTVTTPLPRLPKR
jgi:hypothetical protein